MVLNDNDLHRVFTIKMKFKCCCQPSILIACNICDQHTLMYGNVIYCLAPLCARVVVPLLFTVFT